LPPSSRPRKARAWAATGQRCHVGHPPARRPTLPALLIGSATSDSPQQDNRQGHLDREHPGAKIKHSPREKSIRRRFHDDSSVLPRGHDSLSTGRRSCLRRRRRHQAPARLIPGQGVSWAASVGDPHATFDGADGCVDVRHHSGTRPTPSTDPNRRLQIFENETAARRHSLRGRWRRFVNPCPLADRSAFVRKSDTEQMTSRRHAVAITSHVQRKTRGPSRNSPRDSLHACDSKQFQGALPVPLVTRPPPARQPRAQPPDLRHPRPGWAAAVACPPAARA
jgi:hypothetical protein